MKMQVAYAQLIPLGTDGALAQSYETGDPPAVEPGGTAGIAEPRNRRKAIESGEAVRSVVGPDSSVRR